MHVPNRCSTHTQAHVQSSLLSQVKAQMLSVSVAFCTSSTSLTCDSDPKEATAREAACSVLLRGPGQDKTVQLAAWAARVWGTAAAATQGCRAP